MFHFGFSYIGIIWLLMLFVPNIMWTKRKPIKYDSLVTNENRILVCFERIGEGFVCGLVLIFSDFNIRPTLWGIWLMVSFLFMIMYEIYWIRYFKSERTMADFYSGFLCFPVAGAILPVISFFLLGIYGSNIFMILASVVLGIGHIGIHLGHRNEICGKPCKKKLPLRILRVIGLGILIIAFGVICVVIGMRNVRYFSHYRYIEKGVDEGVFLELSGQQQYVLLRGEDNSNPVIIYLHGGPSSPDAYCTYSFADGLTDNYTFIAWDQRGCGRTYFKNKKEDLCNETVSFEQAIEDLDDLVDYACERFDCETVIIMGHSYGTILGSCYASEYPEKVSAYVGVAQVLSTYKMTKYNYEDAVRQADIAGNDASLMTNAWNRYSKERTIPNVLSVRQETDAYHEAEITGNEIWLSITSPYFGVDDFRWFLKQLGSIDDYIQLNRNLFDVTNDFDIYDSGIDLKLPAYYISGSCDWICPADMIENYASEMGCDYAEIAGCGHSVQYDNPKEFIKAVKGFLEVTRP